MEEKDFQELVKLAKIKFTNQLKLTNMTELVQDLHEVIMDEVLDNALHRQEKTRSGCTLI